MSDFAPLLIVEDIPEVADGIVQACQRCFPGVTAHQADSLHAARQHMANQRFAIALLDIGLPDGSGLDLIPELLSANPSCYCVITTIFDDSEHLFAALKAGASGYLLKDEPPEVFSDHLQGILSGQPPLSARIARRVLGACKPAAQPPEIKLTMREADVLTLIAHGYSVRAAATSLGLSHHTVASYLKEIYRKLQVNSRAEATLQAHTMGLVRSGKGLP